MRWQVGRRSENVEDRRGMSVPRGVAIGGGSGCGLLVLVVVAMLLGVDPMALLENIPSGDVGSGTAIEEPADRGGAIVPSDESSEFVAHVLGDTEDTWRAIFAQLGRQYVEPKLVLFSGMARSACGLGQAAMGPFYCPGDEKVYIDLSFYDELRNRFRAPGDFAQAYVIAHEVGHHVQNLLGITGQVAELRDRMDEVEANALSVRVELQADCYAGVWAHHAQRSRDILEPGDIEEALGAASAIGDDRIQRQTQGTVVPDSFTHGSSAQRVAWFRTGFASGDVERCDTFSSR
jgi:hypothetical protein